MSVLLTVRLQCTLAASHAVSHEYADGTYRRTDGRTPDRYITLSARRGQCENVLLPVCSREY